MLKFNRKIIFIVLPLVLSGAIFAGGFYFGEYHKKCPTCPPSDVDLSLLWETWNELENKYVDKGDLDVQKMIFGAISGMVSSLGDPYTIFFSPDESKIFKEDVRGIFEGVGMEVGVRNGQLQIIAPLENTPAQRAGLRAGDKILEIDGTSTSGMTSEVAVSLIRGKRGTDVKLLIMREGWEESKEFVLTRELIEIPSLKLEIREIGGERVAYLTLYQFSENASFDFNVAANNILNSSAKKIILDLRNNPGGYLEVAQFIAGWFLPEGQVVVTEDFGSGKIKQDYKADGPSDFADYPMVVLINEGSASASEILAGALRDNRNIQLIGQKSFGKGSVQELIDLSDGASVKITVAKWLTPKGVLITDVGLEPDVSVEITDQDYEEGKDPQLDKAIEIIQSL
ncbi:MAG: S41 family peptidase [Patescibacteria group bacterium]